MSEQPSSGQNWGAPGSVPPPAQPPVPQWGSSFQGPQPTPGQVFAGQAPAGQMTAGQAPAAQPYPGPAAQAPYASPGSAQYPGFPPTAPPDPVARKKKLVMYTALGVVLLVVAGFVVHETLGGKQGATAASCDPDTLSSCLIGAPGDATPFAASDGQSETPTTSDYAAWLSHGDAGAQKADADNLDGWGVGGIALRGWQDPDGDGVDITLLRFSSAQGAEGCADQAVSNAMGHGARETALPAGVGGAAYTATATDSDGNIVTQYAAALGDLAVEVTYTSPGTFSGADFAAWVKLQYTAVAGRFPATAAPGPTSVTQTVTCASGAAACLIKAPAGSSAAAGAWAARTSPSVAQYEAQMAPNSAWAAFGTARLKTAGVAGIAHRVWITSNGMVADDVLLTFSSAAGAQDWYKFDAGGASGTSFTIPAQGLAQSTAVYAAKKDSTGSIDAQVYGVAGTTAMELFTWSPGSFDRARTTLWAGQQLAAVQQGAKSETVPVTAPAAPVMTGPIGSSDCGGPAACVLPLPKGAFAWTGSAYDAVSPGIDAYVENYFDGADVSYEEGIFQDGGLSDFAHRAWNGADGSEVDDVLMRFDSAAEAQADALDDQGAALAGGTQLQVPGLTNGVVAVGAANDDGDVPVRVVAWKGDYELRLYFFTTTKGDPQAALDLAVAQLSRLPAASS